jgi:immune inhibitor A
MKKILTIAYLLILCFSSSIAIPSFPGITIVKQPDGNFLSIILHGDEYIHYTTTTDNYTVIKDSQGYYVYARLDGGQLTATAQIAHDTQYRTTTEKTFLQQIIKDIKPEITSTIIDERSNEMKQRAMARARYNVKKFDYNKFRGLVILVEFNDRSFSRPDISEIMDSMINEHNYSGYITNTAISQKVEYTGSVRDYFYDNSFGQFDPHFDVIGPVKIDYSQYYPNGASGGSYMASAAVKAADSLVNYKDYDTDGDGKVDMVYFIYAGGGSNFGNNDSRLIWPHASTLTNLSCDGVTLGRYACSTELYGAPANNILDGIGTICHEFGHVLGLLDEYDTDYTGSGGQSVHPASWSIMSQGSYLNSSRTPCGYSLLERYMTGFATPQLITESGDYNLENIDNSNAGYRINSSIDKEYFLLENRQQDKWNKYLSGHGMLVFRVDSTNIDVWSSNKINANPSHNYYELLRANPTTNKITGIVTDSSGDPFPGSGKVSILNNNSTPNMRSWTGMLTSITLSNIKEAANGKLSFTATKIEAPSAIEDFETMAVTDKDTANVEGRFCNWSFIGSRIEQPDSGICTGLHSVSMVKKSEIETSVVAHNIQSLSFDVSNPSTQGATIRCYYKQEGTTGWSVASDINGVQNSRIESGKSTTIQFNIMAKKHMSYKLVEFTGSTSEKIYIDNFSIRYDDTETDAINTIGNNSNTNKLNAVIKDGTLVISSSDAGNIRLYSADGQLIKSIPSNTHDTMTTVLLSHGVYIVTQGNKRIKVTI